MGYFTLAREKNESLANKKIVNCVQSPSTLLIRPFSIWGDSFYVQKNIEYNNIQWTQNIFYTDLEGKAKKVLDENVEFSEQ